jgi:hypothetical protein
MQRPQGFRCPGSHVGRPHGGDKRRERQERTRQRAVDNGLTRVVKEIDAARERAAGW